MPKYRVVTPKGASFTVAGGGYDYEKEALDPIGAEIIEAPANEAEFIAAAKTADAIYAKGMPITKTIIDALENCKVITLGSVGVDSVDVKAATARGIPVTNIPDTFIEEVADHAMMLLLAGSGGWSSRTRWCAPAAGRRAARAVEDPAADGTDARLHLVRPGGARGRQACRPVRLAHDGLRSLHPGNADVRSRRDSSTLNEVLSQSDFVSMHAPARPEVHHMLTEKHFRQMKKSAVFINTGRGATVDEESLIKALQEGLDRARRPRRAGKGAAVAQQPDPVDGKRHPDGACRLCIGTFDGGAQAPRRLRIVTGPSGHVAGKLCESVGAARHRAPPLAACQHGSRPEQLRRQEGVFGRSGERSAPARRVNNIGKKPPGFGWNQGLRVHRRCNAGNRKTGRVSK